MVKLWQGEVCFVSLSNSFLGLLMYSSYFVLFLQLFLSHYVYNKKPKPAKNDVEVRPLPGPHPWPLG